MSPSGTRDVLFVSVHPPGRVPSQRFRYEQYVDFLDEHGFRTTFAPLLRPDEYGVIYGNGRYLKKARVVTRTLVRRLGDVLRARDADIVFVQREALQVGTVLFESVVARSSARLIFDFDDAIWLLHASAGNKRVAWLKRPSKTSKIIAMADMIFAGNDYLADYAARYNRRVELVPTTIDTERYVKRQERDNGVTTCIGWSGSITTIEHFDLMIPVLRRIRERYGERVRFEVIGDGEYRNEELGIRGRAWNADTEVRDLSAFDIGVMPLPDDEWSRGKCGLKGLQYMALEIPTIMSPVGVNDKIIRDGENGLLAASEDEWFEKLTLLIESDELRRRYGVAARKTVESEYSVNSQKHHYLSLLREVAGQ